MTIQDLGSIGELVAAVATVVTLVYLAVQIRQSASLLESSTAAAERDSYSEVTRILATDKEAIRVFWDGNESQSNLSEPDRRQYDALISLNVFQLMHHAELGRESALTERWDLMFRTHGFQEWWKVYRSTIPGPIVKQVDDRIRDLRVGAEEGAPSHDDDTT